MTLLPLALIDWQCVASLVLFVQLSYQQKMLPMMPMLPPRLYHRRLHTCMYLPLRLLDPTSLSSVFERGTVVFPPLILAVIPAVIPAVLGQTSTRLRTSSPSDARPRMRQIMRIPLDQGRWPSGKLLPAVAQEAALAPLHDPDLSWPLLDFAGQEPLDQMTRVLLMWVVSTPWRTVAGLLHVQMTPHRRAAI